jgi:hypothetical protein
VACGVSVFRMEKNLPLIMSESFWNTGYFTSCCLLWCNKRIFEILVVEYVGY